MSDQRSPLVSDPGPTSGTPQAEGAAKTAERRHAVGHDARAIDRTVGGAEQATDHRCPGRCRRSPQTDMFRQLAPARPRPGAAPARKGGAVLGDRLGESAGKLTGVRVLPTEGGQIKVEVSFQGRGTLLGQEITDTGTYWQTVRPGGVLYGEGHVLFMTSVGDVVDWVGGGVGRCTGPGYKASYGCGARRRRARRSSPGSARSPTSSSTRSRRTAATAGRCGSGPAAACVQTSPPRRAERRG